LDSRPLRGVAVSPGEWFPTFEGMRYLHSHSFMWNRNSPFTWRFKVHRRSVICQRPVISDTGAKPRSSSSKFWLLILIYTKSYIYYFLVLESRVFLNAWRWSARPKHVANFDEINKTFLWFTAAHMLIFDTEIWLTQQ
jgi:hypothetical protein